MPRQAKPSKSARSVRRGPQAKARPEGSTALVRRIPDSLLPAEARGRLADDIAKAFDLAKHSQSTRTQAAYRADREHWSAYARECGVKAFPIPPEYLAAYILHLHEEKFSVSTIRRRCASLGTWHREQGHLSPMKNDAVRDVIKGLLRLRKSAPTKKRALTGELVGGALSDPEMSLRDRTVLAVAFATGLRRSELIALTWEDLTEIDGSFVARIVSSKTDTEGQGAYAAIRSHHDPRMCPARLLTQWRVEWKRTHESRWGRRIFPIGGRTVANIVKRAAKRAGEDPDRYAAHSARAGMITSAGHDASVPQAMTQKAARHARGDQTLDYLDVHNTMKNPAFQAAVNSIKAPTKTAAKPLPRRRRTC